MKFIDKYGEDTTVRALNWKQPFASLMLHGKVETRVWDSKYTGWVLICASKQPYSYKQALAVSGLKEMNHILNILIPNTASFSAEKRYNHITSKLNTGKAIAIGKIYKSELMDDLMINPPLSNEDHTQNIHTNQAIAWATFVEPRGGLYMHHYMEVQKIEPFDWKGKLGWSTIDSETKSKIILI